MGHIITLVRRHWLLLGIIMGSLWIATPPPAQALTYSCDEFGLEAALLTGSGPHTFNCTEPTVITLTTPRIVTNHVILDGSGNLSLSGGGTNQIFQVSEGVTLELQNMILTDGSAENGGAVSVNHATLILNSVQITRSIAAINGGAIFNNGGTVTLTNGSVIENNQAVNGGGVYNTAGGTLIIENSRISGNVALNDGGGIYNTGLDTTATITTGSLIGGEGDTPGNTAVSGGGVYNADSAQLLLQNEGRISGNSASNLGGGIFNALNSTASTSGNFVIASNTALSGGGMANNGLLIAEGSIFRGNIAISEGGAIYNGEQAQATITGSVIQANLPPANAVYNDSSTAEPITIQHSCILDQGVINTSRRPVNARQNWWGSVDGTGENIPENVDTTAHLTHPGDPAPPCQSLVAGLVWLDRDEDGQIDENETGVPGVQVALIDAATQEIAGTTQTSSTGRYQFINPGEETYVLEFSGMGALRVDPASQMIDPTTGRTESFPVTFTTVLADLNLTLLNPPAGLMMMGAENGLTLTEGSSSSYQLVLASEPNAPVTVIIQSGEGVQITGAAELTFTDAAGDVPWNIPQTVSMTVPEDAVVEAQQTIPISHHIQSADPRYQLDAGTLPAVAITVTDNDTAGVDIAPAVLMMTEGGSEAHHITLTSQPTAPVSILPASSSPRCEVEVSGVLDAQNWNTGISVAVQSGDDQQVTGDETCLITHSISSDDPIYAAMQLQAVTVTVTDNDTAAISFDAAESVLLNEGEALSYTARLNTQPAAPITLTAHSSSTLCQISISETFTAENWNTGVTVTVQSPENNIVQGAAGCLISHTTSGDDPHYQFAADDLPRLTVQLSDNDSAGVIVSPGSLTLTEGESASFTLTLTSEPTAPITIQPLENEQGCFMISAGTLDSSNWNTGVVVTIGSTENDRVDGDQQCIIRYTLNTADMLYTLPLEALPAVEVMVRDDDAAGITLSQSELTLPEGQSAAYSLRLLSAPDTPITVEARPSVSGCTAAASGELTAENWQTGITITVEAAENALAEGSRTCTIRHILTSADSVYSGVSLPVPELSVLITDNDTAGVTIGSTSLQLIEGETTAYPVTLTSLPAAPVTVQITSADPACQISVSGALDGGNWSSGITITVTSPDNLMDEQVRTCQLQHSLESGDPAYQYSPGSLPDVTVTLEDNDTAGVSIGADSLQLHEGETITYPLTLTSQPAAPVMVEVLSSAARCHVTVSGDLTAENWQTGIMVEISLPEDEIVQEQAACQLSHRLSSADPAYNMGAEILGVVSVTALDNDRAGVNLSQHEFTLTEGGQASYTLSLMSEPSAPVTLEIQTSPECSLSMSETVVDAGNWQTGVTLTVSLPDDVIVEASQLCTIQHSLSSADPHYTLAAGEAPSLEVTILDNDHASGVVSPDTLQISEGESAVYRLTLTSQPQAEVSVTLSTTSADCAATAAEPFTPENWQTGIEISVSAADDRIAENNRACVVLHQLTSADEHYNLPGDALPSMPIMVIENDSAGASLDAEAFTLTEGQSAAYSLEIASQPAAPVTLEAISNSPECVVQIEGTLDGANWHDGLEITVITTDNFIIERGRTCEITHRLLSEDAFYNLEAIPLPNIVITLNDDDDAAAVFSADTLNLLEGESATYTLALTSMPEGEVQVEVIPSDALCEVVNPIPAVTLENWQAGSPITVRIRDDQIAGGTRTCQLTHRLTSTDPNYNLASDVLASVAVNVEDNDTAGVNLGAESVTQTEGLTNSYLVSLMSQPAAPVTLSVTASNPACMVSVSGELTPENWQTGVSVIIQTPEDEIVQATRTCVIEHTLSSSDPAYNLPSAALPVVNVTIAENDQAGIRISQTALAVTEGESTSYTLSLATQPLQPILVTPASDNPACAVSEAVTLDANNWAAGVVITIRTANDNITQNDTTCQITHRLDTADPFYAALTIPAVTVAVADNDQPGVNIAPLTLNANEGERLTYTVSLNSQPAAPVSIRASSNAASCIMGQEGTLTGENWQSGITLEITIPDDVIAQGQYSCLITHTLQTEDTDYRNAAPATLTVLISDNEVIDLSFSQHELSFREGNSSSYTVMLAVEPASRYTLQVESTDSRCTVALSSDNLNVSNWNTGIAVTVTSHDNTSQDEPLACTITHRLLTLEGTPVPLSNDSVTAQVLDDDVPGVDITPASLAISEGGSGVYSVRLTTEPAEPVTLIVAPETDECSANIFGTLTAENWQSGITVTVVAAEDSLAQGERDCLLHYRLSSADPGYTLLAETLPPLTVTITDNDTAGVSLSAADLSISEGESGNYSLFLNTQPLAPVTVEVISNHESCRITLPEMVLNELNWSTGITVAVTAADDTQLVRGVTCTLLHRLTSTDSAYYQTDVLPVTVTILDNDQASLNISTATLTIPEGEVASYSLSLSHQPAAPVNVQITASDAGCIVSAVDQLTAENWQAGISVMVQAAEDQVLSARICTLTHQLSSSDAAFSIPAGLPTVTVSVQDNEIAGLQPEPAALVISEGESASYTLHLTSQPQADVTITAVSDHPDCGVNISNVFSAENWQPGIPVAVNALENNTAGEPRTCLIRHTLSSADPAYNLSGDLLPTVTITLMDDDQAGMQIEPLRLNIVEGEQASAALRLTSQPQQPVEIEITSNNVVCAVSSPIISDSSNWQNGIPIIVTTLDNAVYNEAQFCSLAVNASSADPAYNFGAVATIQVTVLNNEPDTLLLQPGSLEITEGETGEYHLTLTSAPQAPVTVQILPLDAACTVTDSIMLDATNWQSGASVQVAVVDDALATSGYRCTIQHRLLSEESRYTLEPDALPILTLSASDNDTASVVIGTAAAAQSEGRSNSYVVSLTSQPTAPVQLLVQSSNPLCTAVVSGDLDAANWNTGITVTITSSDDQRLNTPRTCIIQHSTSSADPAYNLSAGRLPAATITVTDNDVAGFQAVPAEISITEGAQAAYTVTLTSQPNAPVRVETISDTDLCIVSSTVTLDAANWNSGAQITVEAMDDTAILSEQSCTLRHQITSSDTAYNLIADSLPTVQVIIEDNDIAGIQLDTSQLILTEGSSGSYSVTLTSQPAAPVEINPAIANATCTATVSGLLDSSNWNTGVMITVSTLDDQQAGSGGQCNVLHYLSSSDPNYVLAGADLPALSVEVLENDTAGVVIEPQTLALEEGASAEYRVTLASQPAAPVQVNAVSSTELCQVSANLILDAGNWNAGVLIRVQTVDNTNRDEERQCSITHQFTSDDPAYNLGSENLPAVSITVLDDDEPGVIIEPLALSVREGGSVSYTVRLATPPAAPATLNLIPSNPECSPATSGSLDSSNWNTGITITITVAQNSDMEGNRACSITHHSLGSSDPAYAVPPGVMPAVQITIVDDETVPFPLNLPDMLRDIFQRLWDIMFWQ